MATTVVYDGDIYQLTKMLTDSFPMQVVKARAIFRWIAENISYDFQFYNKYHETDKEQPTYKCRGAEDCAIKKIEWETSYLSKVLKKKKAVCQGYAMLFQKMCTIAGLKSEIIPGYVRSRYYQVGGMGSLDHAWNAVWIDSAYYLVDVTWAAGGCSENEDGKLLAFHKQYHDYYWLTPPQDFARNHFPKNSQWTLLKNYTKEDFSQNPYYLPGALPKIKLLEPVTGVINAKKGDTIKFKIDYSEQVKYVQVNSNIFRNPDVWVVEDANKKTGIKTLNAFALKRQQYIEYKQQGNVYEFEYVVTDASLYYVDILFDTQRVMRSKVNIVK
ncbi:MAG: transglutaminase domain-containing protein [Bacteroidota bacterium]